MFQPFKDIEYQKEYITGTKTNVNTVAKSKPNSIETAIVSNIGS